MKYIRVKQWDRFQHYKDRNPPWIKLYNDLLSTQEWVSTNNASRALMIASMLLASRTNNRIPADMDYIRKAGCLNETPDYSELLAFDFVEIIDESGNASELLAECYQNARESREEKSREEKSRSNSDARPRGTRLPKEWLPTEEQKKWAHESRPDLDIDLVSDAFRDYWIAKAGTGGVKLDWDATFRNWVRNQKAAKSAVSVDWWSSDPATLAYGMYKKMPPRPGEDMATYRGRLRTA